LKQNYRGFSGRENGILQAIVESPYILQIAREFAFRKPFFAIFTNTPFRDAFFAKNNSRKNRKTA
jgi:hypothetical protein